MRGNSSRASSAPRAPRRLAPATPALPRAPTIALAAALLLATLAALSGCAPTVETPAEAAYRRDLRDAQRISAQLLGLPRVKSAHVTLTRPAADPLRSPAAIAQLPSASVVLVLHREVRHGGDSLPSPAPPASPLAADARALVTAVAPELSAERIAVLAHPEAPPVELSRVGPFEVTSGSRRPLLIALLCLLALCAGLGATLAVRERARRAVTRTAES